MDPSVGIVIPSYKNAHFLRRTVLSLFAQDWPHWQAVVVDDGSPEPSRDQIVDLLGTPQLRYFWKPNGGVASARNFGWQKLPRELSYLMFLDGDDVLTPNALRRMVAELMDHPRAGMVHCEPLMIDEEDNVISDYQWPPRWTWGPRILKPTDRFTPFESIYTMAGLIPSLVMIRRETYEQTPGWDENFGQHCEDTDLFLHIALRSAVRYLPEKLVSHRRHAMQSTATNDRFARQEAKLYAKWRCLGKTCPEKRQIIARAEWFRIGPLAARLGLEEARRYLVDGELRTALRFFLGAVRRKLRSMILGPEAGYDLRGDARAIASGADLRLE
jgi:glycosyltransferase involved in cell wall biosynthesis